MPRKKILTEEETTTLAEGFKSGSSAQERRKAESLLSELGYTKVAKRKPGPKPESSRNRTEEEIQHHLDALRFLFGDGLDDLSVVQVLKSTAHIFRLFRYFCKNGLFFQADEKSKIDRIARVADKLSYDWFIPLYPSLSSIHPLDCPSSKDELRELIEDIGMLCSRPGVKNLDVPELIERGLKRAKTKTVTLTTEAEAYHQLNKVLGLERSGCRQGDSQTKQEMGTQQPGASTKGVTKKPSRTETLRLSIAEFFRMNYILRRTRFVRIDDSARILYISLHFNSKESPPSERPKEFNELEGLLLKASGRQPVNPFRVIAPQELEIGPPSAPDRGQVITAFHLYHT